MTVTCARINIAKMRGRGEMYNAPASKVGIVKREDGERKDYVIDVAQI